jgi:hypothetical protein
MLSLLLGLTPPYQPCTIYRMTEDHRETDLKPLLNIESSAGLRDPDGTVLYVRGHWTQDGDVPVCIGVEIWKDAIPAGDQPIHYLPLQEAPAVGLRATDLRKINLGAVLRDLWADAQEREQERRQRAETLIWIDRVADLGTDEQISKIQAILDEDPSFEAGSSRRKGKSDRAHFEKVAAIYRAGAKGRAPTKAVQEAFRCSYSTATKWVRTARDDYGLLPKTEPGYASRIPGENMLPSFPLAKQRNANVPRAHSGKER